ncbi:class C beta-lactamase-related serine hydrolase [Nocardia panacis]|uniref:Class C beta-lactamase-related serine hydrolase n=2 Tax=Nocardia panacis TaxID=2340916 RepID=A0A3A4KQ76_9NOCA|nr:class C beta-lactamase-related serine hydrolase [Nocardia panacis]
MVGAAAVALVAGGAVAAGARAEDDVRCLVSSAREFERARPEAVGLDTDRLNDALRFAKDRNRLNVQVFRNDCLVGVGPGNELTGGTPWNIWSSTKSVVSLLAGIAWDRGALDLRAPIDKYLPPGLGDTGHRSITVQDLLTEASGLRVSAFTEGITGVFPIDPNSAVQALGVRQDHPPGTHFSYSQRSVDLLSYVIELAINEPLQDFAQRELFDPLGIRRSDYYWARDRSAHTYGYAHLLIPPDDFARIGLLVANEGHWGTMQVVSSDYMAMARTPSRTNECYGYLFWLGPGCAEIPDFLPHDTYAISGLGLQNVFIIPSLHLTVMWTGIFGNISRQGLAGAVQNQAELPYEFFRKLLAAFLHPPIPDPGPYIEPPAEVDPRGLIDTDMLLAVFGIGPDAYPGCNVFNCLNEPLAAPFSDTPPGCVIVVCLGSEAPGIRE